MTTLTIEIKSAKNIKVFEALAEALGEKIISSSDENSSLKGKGSISVENETSLSKEMIDILDNRLNEDASEYLTAQESIDRLHKKYGI